MSAAEPPESAKDPPRIAVALRYDEGDGAPVVLATGKGSLAERILDAAKEAGVAIDENPMLANALEKAPVGEPIPEELYQAVAEVINWVLQAQRPAKRAR
jgi:flagellar biosynthesis protein